MKAAIFDLDGTVAGSIQPDIAAWEKLFREFNKEFTINIYKEFSGMTGKSIIVKYLEQVPEKADKLQDKKEEYFMAFADTQGIAEVPGVRELIQKLKEANFKIGLATAATRDKVDSVLEQINLTEQFESIVTANDVTQGKPHPEPFLKAAEALGTSAEECVVFEDAPNGIRAAKAAGMKCVAITTTHYKEELLEADIIIDNFSNLDISIL